MQVPTKTKQHFSIFIGQSRLAPFLFLLPAALVILFVVLYPLLYVFKISFQDITISNLITGNYPWIFFDNYLTIFQDKLFWATLVRTIVWTVVNVSLQLVLGLNLAIMLNRRLPGKSFLRVLLILPWAIPQYIVALTWKGMFNYEYGVINLLIKKIFGHDSMIPWLSDPNLAFIACIITNIWLGIPFMMMISLGGLQSIPKELYEAAEVDGVNEWKKFKHITLPLLKPVLTPAVILGTLWTFTTFNIIFIITSGAALEESQILITLVYKQAFEYFRYGYTAALSVIIFFILLVFSGVFTKYQKIEG